MAYVPVPKDLTKVKTKVALNLTKRQLIFFSLAAVVGIPFSPDRDARCGALHGQSLFLSNDTIRCVKNGQRM